MAIRKLLSAIDISASGMRAQRRRMDAVASNIANAETTRTENGEPYRKKIVVMRAAEAEGSFEKVLAREDQRIKITRARHIRTVPGDPGTNRTMVGVEAEEKTLQQNAFRLVYDPDHPDSDANGYVRMPNINVVSEMVEMIAASRGYEANATAIEASKTMSKKALEI